MILEIIFLLTMHSDKCAYFYLEIMIENVYVLYILLNYYISKQNCFFRILNCNRIIVTETDNTQIGKCN